MCWILLNAKKHFPILPVIVLIAGSILLIVVLLISFSPALFQTKPIENIPEAKDLAEQYIARYYEGLEVEEIMEFSNNYYIIVKETDTGNAAFELLIDRYYANVSPEPGPNMMWNTKYGHHRLGNPTIMMPVTLEEAERNAQEWLDRNILGSTVEESEIFYGYYTIDLEKDGEIFGMLSVNGYSGDVWYHSWHGDFISMEEYN